jgi:hypothetical protein
LVVEFSILTSLALCRISDGTAVEIDCLAILCVWEGVFVHVMTKVMCNFLKKL